MNKRFSAFEMGWLIIDVRIERQLVRLSLKRAYLLGELSWLGHSRSSSPQLQVGNQKRVPIRCESNPVLSSAGTY
jgi:hypothetical protein